MNFMCKMSGTEDKRFYRERWVQRIQVAASPRVYYEAMSESSLETGFPIELSKHRPLEREQQRSLDCARDDDTGKRQSDIRRLLVSQSLSLLVSNH